MTLWSLFWLFFYIGLITIGGGQVAITIMYQLLVEKGLITPELFYNMVAISESTPGPIGINMATYIGCEMYGVWGGIITTLGTIAPSIIIILCIAKYYDKLKGVILIQNVFKGLRPVVTGLILVAAWSIIKISVILLDLYAPIETNTFWQNIAPLFQWQRILAYVVFVIMLLKTKLPSILYIVLGAIVGILVL
jgi:chromate transporter